MGQAKQRGTFEQRLAAAKEREANALLERRRVASSLRAGVSVASIAVAMAACMAACMAAVPSRGGKQGGRQ